MSTVGLSLSGNPVSASSQAQSTSSVSQLLRFAAAKGNGQVSGGDNDGDTQRISKAGAFLSKLQSLKASDPAKFKDLMNKISAQLSAAAQQAGAGTQQNLLLSDLAAKFKDVANGGDLSQLQPSGAASNSLQQAYGQSVQGSQQALLDFVKTGAHHQHAD